MSKCCFYFSRIMFNPKSNDGLEMYKKILNNQEYIEHCMIRGLFSENVEYITFIKEKEMQWLVRSSEKPKNDKDFLSIITKEVCIEFNNNDIYNAQILCSPQIQINKKKCDPVKYNYDKSLDKKIILLNWMENRKDKFGFNFAKSGDNIFTVNDIQLKDLPKNPQYGKHRVCKYNGLIKITDHNKFLQSFLYGIGSFKFAGYGMINISK